MTTERKKSQRSRSHEAMLKKALSRPGVYEAIEIFQGWERQKQAFDAYRDAVNPRIKPRTQTTPIFPNWINCFFANAVME